VSAIGQVAQTVVERIVFVVVPIISSLVIGAIGLVVELRSWAVVAAVVLLVAGGILGFVETGRPLTPTDVWDEPVY